jgi:RND family efflux transporter MFP subunit
MNRGRLGAIVVGVCVVALVFYLLWPRGPQSAGLAEALQTAEVVAADFYVPLPLTGVVEPERSAPVVNIVPDTEIAYVVPDGTSVMPGDVIMRLEASDLKEQLDRQEVTVTEAEDKVRATQADVEKQLQNAETGLAKAEDGQRKAEIQSQAAIEKAQAEIAFLEKEVEVAQGELDKRKRLQEERLMPITEVERAEDELRAKQFNLEKARLALARAVEDAEITQRVRVLEVQKAQLQLRQAEANEQHAVVAAERDLATAVARLEELREQFEAADVKAPVAGLVMLSQTWDDGMRALRVGDRMYEGQRLANIIDPQLMRVRCDISEADIESVEVGQAVTVRAPALGDKAFPGEVSSIDNIARARNVWEGGIPGKKVFGALIKLLREDEELRPGMGASIEIQLSHVTEGMAVPVEAVFERDDEWVVYVAEGERYRRVAVTVGERNEFVASVEGDLEVGDRVACAKPPEAIVIEKKTEAKP